MIKTPAKATQFKSNPNFCASSIMYRIQLEENEKNPVYETMSL